MKREFFGSAFIAGGYGGSAAAPRTSARRWSGAAGALLAGVASALGGLATAAGCRAEPEAEVADDPAPALPVVESPPGIARPPFAFSAEDEQLLDEVQRGAFNFLWSEVHPETGLLKDRSSKPIVSVAGVGFQLSGLCVGVERGWITHDQGYGRAVQVLRSLEEHPDNRKAGLFYHFLLGRSANPDMGPFEHVVSTIDSAILFSGMLTASSYFKGEVAERADRMFAEADWAFFKLGDDVKPWERGFISLGWKPADDARPSGDGELLPYGWLDAGCEHRLVTFLGVCAPEEANRLEPALYYRLRRQLGSYADTGPFVYLPWSGALFTSIFSHCWIDYAAMGPDDPARFGVERRPRVDWWENSRRAVNMHRVRAVENPRRLPTLGENAWGLTASDVATGYAVPGLFPRPLPTTGLRPEFDIPTFKPKESWGDGTIAPYGAGSAVMFEPEAAVAALRHYREVARRIRGQHPLWQDPAAGGYGFADAYNEGTGWVAPDCVAIDQGPLLLSIENARTGLIWRLFYEHPAIRGGMERLALERRRR